jgi:hypothetical protein
VSASTGNVSEKKSTQSARSSTSTGSRFSSSETAVRTRKP